MKCMVFVSSVIVHVGMNIWNTLHLQYTYMKHIYTFKIFYNYQNTHKTWILSGLIYVYVIFDGLVENVDCRSACGV